MHQTPWLVHKAGTTRRLRLYCFSYAGGSAAGFASWQAALDPFIEVCAIQLPGRGTRFREVPYASMRALIKELGSVIGGQPKHPFAFFGHSLGALVAFEVTRYFMRHALPMPERLIASGCNAPRIRRTSAHLHTLDDDALIEALKKYNGTPPEILAHRELMDLLLPTIRADFHLIADYKYHVEPLLNIPITVLTGKLDDHVSPQRLGEWQNETTAACRIHSFEGDHFFINSARNAVLTCLGAELADFVFCDDWG